MPAKKPAPKRKPKLTDAERHKRFVDMANEVSASVESEAFDRAFKAVAKPRAVKGIPKQ